MKAAVVRGVDELAIEDSVDLAPPGPGEVRVRMLASGVCHTDLSVLRGRIPMPLPLVLGHEGAGIVEEVGAGVTRLRSGDHVVLTVTVGCGQCFMCGTGAIGLCEIGSKVAHEGTLLDGTTRLSRNGEALHHLICQGSLAEYAVVPEVAAVKVREDAPMAPIAPLACGAATGIGAVLNRAQVRPGESVTILGAGGVGLAALLAAHAVGAYPIIVADLSKDAREAALDLGATHVVDPAETDLVTAVNDTLGRGSDYTFDVVGTNSTITTCLDATRNGGETVVVGVSDASVTASVGIFSLINEKRLTGTFAGSLRPQRDIPAWVNLFLDGRLPLDKLVTRSYTLDALPEAITDMEAHRAGRGVVTFD